MRGKRGIELSFGMLFSILIIAATIAVAFYVINYFLDLKKCTEIGLFTRDLQNKVTEAWNSDSVKDSFTGFLPGNIDKVCIGNLNLGKETEEYELLKRYKDETANLFFYPPPKTCEIKYANIEHAEISGFNCTLVKNGRASLRLEKDSFDNLVKVSA